MDPNQLPQASAGRKRKAEAQKDNERLSKRLSLLNIEHDGTKLYVPVESPLPSPNPRTTDGAAADDTMHIDDSKHKVYIYNIDEELAEDSEPDEAKLVFLPDIEKRLRETRIPPQILANSEGELAGMQLVLYSDPKSLSVPEAKDGVRKAIIETRRRIRARQAGAEDDEVDGISDPIGTTTTETMGQNAHDDVEMNID
ncbi:hypothetical protein LMH87_006029 [Akanthomyces muscarius]|uniref:Uncharacterized protein n=1 Tax=Akanthomyces muscarius TaxID=2231603 RepID=A0A9W8QQ33_AKAMU|nr:hypothetical protein LMH87_006029 [Akanthomyces muscarius]KAJ4164352.1 hypothetical protein LMH87_006029 [Akanthomyces muscarius]